MDSEARCAAVWGLGVAGSDRPDLVLEFIADEDDDVALHALAAINHLPDDLIAALQRRLSGSAREGASAALLLARQGEAAARALLETAQADGDARSQALAALGRMSPTVVRRAAGGDIPPEVAEALAPVWALTRSWLNRAEADDPVTFLSRQTVSHKPPEVA
jgi:hypothetical protein